MILDLAMKINRNFWKRVVRTAAIAAVGLIGTVGKNAVKAQEGEVGQTAQTAQAEGVASTAPSDVWVEDGFPLIYRRDGAALEAIWNALEPNETGKAGKTGPNGKLGKTPAEPFADAVDFQLRRQGPKYKGKTLALRGRLLRAVWVPTLRETARNGEVSTVEESKESEESGGFYDLWVLLPDSKRDPVRLLTRRAPPGFKVDERLENATAYSKTVEYRRETVEADAVYYRTTAFDGGDDFYAAPTLVAVDFRWSGAADGDARMGKTEKTEKTGGRLGVKIGGVALIVAVWLLARRLTRRKSAGKREKKPLDLPDSIEPFAFLLVAAGAFVGAVRAETPEVGGNDEAAQIGEIEEVGGIGGIGETAQDDAAFWSVAIGVDVDAWRRETASSGEIRPKLDSTEAGERRRIAGATFERLARLVSPSVLTERFGENAQIGRNGENGRIALVGTLGDYVAAAPSERPKAVPGASVRYFCGTALRIDRLPTGADESARIGGDALYRVVVALDSPENGGVGENGGNGRTLVVYSPNVPKFAAPSSFFDADAKRGEIGEMGEIEKAAERGVGERVGGLGVLFGREADGAVALASRVGWFPTDAPLGRLGVDLSAFEGAPIYPIRALTAEKDPTRRREIARTLRWTSADVRPFYETLAAVRRDSRRDEKTVLAPDSRFASESEKIVSLFNRPERNQGRVVKLRGRVRRANLVLVDDSDVVASTGVDRYYQLYLFANDSQGWPLVLCVPELPDGLKVGGGMEYRREIEFVGAFTKTWAYKTSAQKTQIAESTQDAQTLQSAETAESTGPGPWGRVPVLVGRVVNVVPEEPATPKAPFSPTALVVGFAVLSVAWVALRRRAARPPRTGKC